MHKTNINTLISKSLQGSLTADEQQELNKRLAADASLRQRYMSLLESDNLVCRYREYSEVDKDEAARKFIKRHLDKSDRPHHAWLHYASYAAAVAAILIIVALWHSQSGGTLKPVINQEVAQAMNRSVLAGKNAATLILGGGRTMTVCSDSALAAVTSVGDDAEGTLVTHHDKEFWLVLDDGTRVHLNYNSSLTYPLHFTGDTRTVELEGEAYFFVAKDSKRPFYVKTKDGMVKEYGTEFDVNTVRRPGATEVVLVRGSISVITPSGERMMKVGQKAVLDTQAGQVSVGNVDVAPYVAWNEGRFVFEDCEMSRLMDVLSMWYGRKVQFADSTLGDIKFTGTLDRYGQLDEVLRAIESVTNVTITDDGKEIKINQ